MKKLTAYLICLFLITGNAVLAQDNIDIEEYAGGFFCTC